MNENEKKTEAEADHIEKVREFLGADKYDAIETPEAGHEH